MFFFLSEFLAEESQDKFWDFVEANQNIEGEHDGNLKLPQTPKTGFHFYFLCWKQLNF